MNSANLKYYVGIISILVLDSLHRWFFENNSKFDVYLFYNHERYFTNILYDISNLFKFSILTYWLIKVNTRVFTPLFITSLFIWVSYFAFYNQKSSILIIPIYVITTIIYNKKLFKK
tara:strand:+ start:169 stop:519 length:351 start_codon:yes stop_codon:yes gene_type:complete